MLKNYFLLAALCFLFSKSEAQKITDKKLCIAFYNCENFFDTINDPQVKDEEFLPDAKTEWNTKRYDTKKKHIAQVISSMNNNNGADLIGLSEVENKAVLEDLIKEKTLKKSNYGIVHYNSADERGIDVALLYKKKIMKVIGSSSHRINFPFDATLKTRDFLVVKAELQNGKQIYFLVNHFPSRRSGTEESERKRIFVAETEKHVIDSIVKADNNASFIAMGDLNDEPMDKSVQTLKSADAKFNNPFEELKNKNEGSIYYKGEWSLFDQILVSKNLLDCKTSKACYEANSCTIYKPDFVLEQTAGKYFGAPFKTFAGTRYFGGYSDHMSVYILLDLK
jgi:predicted extracellular nuclease